MIFCTYCGNGFTRKEHLERHLPSHTNVKPHRCSLCYLSFPRKDLLQRHHFTYHEPRDPMQPVPGGVSSITGRTRIACENCATAKIGCDKNDPCSKCSEKNLTCVPRWARRPAKAALRSQSFSNPTPRQQSRNSPARSDHVGSSSPSISEGSIQQNNVMDIQQQGEQKQMEYPTPPMQHLVPGTFGTVSGASVRGITTSMYRDDELLNGDVGYELMMWDQFTPDLDMYQNPNIDHQHNIAMPPFMDLASTSSNSDAMASDSTHSMNTSISTHTRSTSIASGDHLERPFEVPDIMHVTKETSIPEFEVVIAAEAAWPLARCNRPIFSGSCPRTAIVHLENLEAHSKHEDTWKLLDSNISSQDIDYQSKISVVPLNASTRDRILAITQSFLHTALETHRGGLKGWAKAANTDGGFNFLVLPPSKVLEYFLRSYVRSLSPYYTLVHGGMLDPNELMLNSQASTLLLLLAIAYGAAALPTAEARCLTAGLTETCRISLFHIIEKDVELSADPIVLRCALLFVILAAWSGDAWHMNIAMGQRGMYLAMLKHAGMLEPSPMMEMHGGSSSTELRWREWQHRDSKSRLVYNWVMVDQELSLFHDTAPILSITELETPMPGPESLWLAKDAVEWLAAVQQSNLGTDWMNPNSLATPPLTPSLCDLFQDMLHDNIDSRYTQLSPLQLKLLLHPLQSLLCHLRQVLSCFSDFFGSRRGSRTVTKASTLLRLEEVQSLLQKWYELCVIHAKNDPSCPVTRANLVLYHLISLNAVTSFPEIERLARKEGFDGSTRELMIRHKRCIHQPEEALIHCGQVIRLICSMPREGRPHWWSAAIYRAALIMWLDSLLRMDQTAHRMEKGQIFAIDAVMPDDPAAVSYAWRGEGIPVLSNGHGHVSMLPDQILNHCIALLDQGVALRISDGIKRKLQLLAKNWSMEKMSV